MLLVVSVTAVTGFSSWFQTFSSETFTEVEQQGGIDFSLKVEGLIDNVLYLKSGSETNLTLLKVQDENGNELCSFKNNLNLSSQNLLIHYSFENSYLNGSNYYVEDSSGNGYDGKLVSESLWALDNNYSALGTSNETYILFNLYYKKEPRFDSGSFNGCYVKFGNQFSKILEDVNLQAPSIWSREFYLESELTSFSSSSKFSFICNNSNFFNLDGKVTFDGLDDFIRVENSSFILDEFMDYNNDFTILFDVIPGIFEGNIFTTRSRDCGTADFLSLNFRSMSLFFNYPIQNTGLRNPGSNSNLGFLAFRNQFNGTRSFLSFNSNLQKNSTTLNVTNYHISNSEIILGKSPYCNNNEVKGSIEDFRIYNYSFSDEELKEVYFSYIRDLNKGINQIDLSSCNMNKGNIYNIVAFTNNNKIEHSVIAK